jgi:23S rRNA pseudouridine1911/1915/1917 synthase
MPARELRMLQVSRYAAEMNQPLSLSLIVEAELHGVRIDSFLVRHLRNYSPWRMQRLAAAGHVLVDHVPADPTRRVFTGETVEVLLVEPPDVLLDPHPVPFEVLYEDAWMLVVDKPAGVIAHPTGAAQSHTLANGLQQYLDARSPLPGLVRPGIVHRLDRHTSGLMVVATHYRAHAELSTAFESGRVAKTYIALVERELAPESGTIDLPIGRAKTGRGVLMSARGDAVGARPATTHYRVLQRLPGHTLVEARPRTGRNHQIRVHFAQIGNPLVGDEFYAAGGTFRTIPPVPPPGWHPLRHALHAAGLELTHPITGVWMQFRTALASDMRRLVEDLEAGRRVVEQEPVAT